VIVGLGTDVAELDRIRSSCERFGERFLNKVLTPREREIMPAAHPVPFLAAQFAGKEAAAKALGTGLRQGVTLPSLEILRLDTGQPTLVLLGAALERARVLNVRAAHVSLTHGRDIAQAVVVLET
jgi:holo-[acyl-carrier protein] synthase